MSGFWCRIDEDVNNINSLKERTDQAGIKSLQVGFHKKNIAWKVKKNIQSFIRTLLHAMRKVQYLVHVKDSLKEKIPDVQQMCMPSASDSQNGTELDYPWHSPASSTQLLSDLYFMVGVIL